MTLARALRAALVGVAALAASPAAADPDPAGAAAVAASAAKIYASGHYTEAARSFDSAYAIDPLPSYLFNAAQAYRLANQCDEAADRYEKFLGVAKDVQNLDKVRAYLETERACAKAHAPPEPVTPPPVTAPTPPVPVVPAPVPRAPSAPPHASRAWLKWTGVGVGVAGLGLFAFGLWEHGQVTHFQNLRDKCTPMTPCAPSVASDIDHDGALASGLMVTGLGVGGAAVIGGVVMVVLGRDPETAQITPTPGGAIVSTRLHF